MKFKHPAATRIISNELERSMARECKGHNSRSERWLVGSYELQAMHASLFVKLHTCAIITTQYVHASFSNRCKNYKKHRKADESAKCAPCPTCSAPCSWIPRLRLLFLTKSQASHKQTPTAIQRRRFTRGRSVNGEFDCIDRGASAQVIAAWRRG